MLHQWRLLPLVLIVASCAAPTRRIDFPLTDETFQSADGVLHGRVPKGWFVSTDIEVAPHLSSWLVREDYAATLAFQEIFPDRDAANHIDKVGLSMLAELSFRLKQAEEPNAQITSLPREFTVQGKSFCRYEYVHDKQGVPRGVAVFAIRNRYFESVALPTKDTFSRHQLMGLFNLQEAVLGSLEP